MKEDIIKRFEAIENRLNLLEGQNTIAVPPREMKKKSVKEFILEKSPKGKVQETVCISYYLEKFEEKDLLASKDIQKCFKDAKLKTPPNVPDKVQKAIAKGWIAKGEKRGEFYLTSTGEKIVETNFKGENNGRK